jgi:hypothetical protein
MPDYKDDAMFDIRAKLWADLIEYNIFDEEDYYSENIGGTIIPIFPVQQVPELNQFLSGKKHIIYDKISTKYDPNWWMCQDQIMFTLYSTEYDEVIEIQNLIIDLFRRYEDSADDVQNHGSQGHGPQGAFKFFSTRIADINPIGPSSDLQGFFEGQIVIEVMYARQSDAYSGRYI